MQPVPNTVKLSYFHFHMHPSFFIDQCYDITTWQYRLEFQERPKSVAYSVLRFMDILCLCGKSLRTQFMLDMR